MVPDEWLGGERQREHTGTGRARGACERTESTSSTGRRAPRGRQERGGRGPRPLGQLLQAPRAALRRRAATPQGPQAVASPGKDGPKLRRSGPLSLGTPWWPSCQGSVLSLPWPGFSPWLGTCDPPSCAAQTEQNEVKKKKRLVVLHEGEKPNNSGG